MHTPNNYSPMSTPYLVTFNTLNSIDVFTDHTYREVVIDSLKHCQQTKGLIIHAWCINCSQVKLIASNGGVPKLSDIIRDCKAFTSRSIRGLIETRDDEHRKHWMLWMMYKEGAYNSNNKDFQFWEQNNHPLPLSRFSLASKIDEIHNIPVMEGFVAKPEHWLHSSAIDYAEGKGLLDIFKVRY